MFAAFDTVITPISPQLAEDDGNVQGSLPNSAVNNYVQNGQCQGCARLSVRGHYASIANLHPNENCNRVRAMNLRVLTV